MKLRKKTFALSALLACTTAALFAAACGSSSSGGSVTEPVMDAAGGTATERGGTSSDAGSGGGTDAGAAHDAGANACADPPKLVVPKPDGGLFCPFSAHGDSGADYCKTPTQMCCVSPSDDAGPSDCEALAATCAKPDFARWECSAPSECEGHAAGPVCCLVAGPLEADPDCAGHQKTKGFDSTRCLPAGKCTGTVVVGTFTNDQTIVCEAQADCAAGKTCTAVKTSGAGIGVCL